MKLRLLTGNAGHADCDEPQYSSLRFCVYCGWIWSFDIYAISSPSLKSCISDAPRFASTSANENVAYARIVPD